MTVCSVRTQFFCTYISKGNNLFQT